MTMIVRRSEAADVPVIGRICFEAFRGIAAQHNFPPDLPGPEAGAGLMAMLAAHPGVYDLVAELDGRIAGSNFMDERNPISGIGPITIDPALQNGAVGRALMQAALDRARERGVAGVRLVQAGYHCRSLALYLKLGFEVRGHLSCLQGTVAGAPIEGSAVRAATAADVADCDALCLRVHGHARGGELADAVGQGMAQVVERGGRISGYTTGVGFFGHAVGEANADVEALIAAAPAIAGPGVLVPTANGALVRWCLDRGLRITQPMTLMSLGLYNEPQGAWLPSIIY